MDGHIFELLNRNGIWPVHVALVNDGTVWQCAEGYIVKAVGSELCAKKCMHISRSLTRSGVSTVQCIDYLCRDGSAYLLMGSSQGRQLSARQFLAQSHGMADALATATAALHNQMSRIRCPFPLPKGDLHRDFCQAMVYLQTRGLRLPPAVNEICSDFIKVYEEMPRQLIHRDIQLRNLLFEQEGQVSFLDLDSCETNIRIHDLAYFGLTLLHDLSAERCVPLPMEMWKRFIYDFILAYHSNAGLTTQEACAIYPLFVLLEVCFLFYYLQQDHPQVSISDLQCILTWLCDQRRFFDTMISDLFHCP